ncbi:MAG: Ig-like domain-containing protein [Deltaproteobacteria bacterium]|nr:Ig-like domain-containing protein [Deltaproteobacteria bacterium]
MKKSNLFFIGLLGMTLLTFGCQKKTPLMVTGYSVAQAGGGVFFLPLGDPAAMERLQGIGVEPRSAIKLISPAPGTTLDSGRVEVRYQIENFNVGMPEPRQHVHVILDNEPYVADYSASGSTVLENVPEGTHTLSVFLARKFHLSLKNPEAFAMATFHVVKESSENRPAPDEPMLIYSRPKGEYSQKDGSADYIMLDFYLRNVALNESEYRIKVRVNHREPIILTKWEPIILLEKPAPGKYEVLLELIDRSGNRVPGAFTGTTRTVQIVP